MSIRVFGRRLVPSLAIALLAAAGIGPAFVVEPARAVTPSAVRDWNLNAANALSNLATATIPGAGQTPPVTAVHMAMVQGAVYDAVNAIVGGYEPYIAGLPVFSRNDSQEAAAATAAHHVLVGLTPALPAPVLTWVNAAYAASLAAIPDGAAKNGGIAAGAAAASAMLINRTNDGRYVPFAFTVGTQPGEWRPDLPAFVNDPFAWMARVRPFMMTSPSQFRSDGPNALTSAEYAEEFNEVKDLGSASSVARTTEQTAIARFYTDHATAMWNRTFRTIAENEDLTLAEEARLFAMLNMAGADSLIGCWDSKWFWNFWRPITAIRQAGSDGNAATSPDPTWLPLINTPPYPDEPSGFNCITSAFMHTAQDFFGGDKMTFDVLSNATGVTRHYDRFSDTFKDTIDARVWLGIHFRSADVSGVVLGKKVAHWLDKHYFQPLGKKPRGGGRGVNN